MNHFKELEDLYLRAPINEVFKPTISVKDGSCTITMEANPQHHHAAHALHGSILFKMLDDAAFFAANSKVSEFFVLTGTFTIRYHKPVSSGLLTANGIVDSIDNRKISASSEVYDENDNLIASGQGIFIISSIKLSEL